MILDYETRVKLSEIRYEMAVKRYKAILIKAGGDTDD